MTTPQWNRTDAVLCAVFILGIALLLWHTGDLSYEWNWQKAWGYVISHDESGYSAGLLIDGLVASIRLLIFSGVLALALALLVAVLLMSPMRAVAVGYVEVLRNMPPLVFMFIFFYLTGSQVADWIGEQLGESDSLWLQIIVGDSRRVGNFISGIVCLAIFESAFFAEIIRAGILSVPRGQWDAARALGIGRIHTLRLIILPQAWKNAAAPMVGQMILLIKDSAILSVISVPELTFSAQEASVSSRQIFETWLLAAAFYFALCFPLMRFSQHLERRPS